MSLQAFALDVSSETAYVINRMLHKDPNQRYASYGKLIDHFKYAIDTLTASTTKPRVARERVVVESQSQNNLVGILTLILLALLLIGGGLAFYYRDRLLDGGDNANAPSAASNALTSNDRASVEAAYEDARHQIVAGQYADAQESFKSLLQRSDLTQPLLNWSRLHYGMTALLNQQVADARVIFGNLQRAGIYSNDAGERALANLFPETGRNLADDKNIPAADATKLWKKDTFENIALFLFALKDWEQGDFDDANQLFDAYLAGRPPAPFQWIGDYAPIARKCMHDFALYAPLRARRAAGNENPSALETAFSKARGQLQTTGRIVEAFFTAETDLAGGKAPVGISAEATLAPLPNAATARAAVAPVPTPTLAPMVARDVHDAETVRWQTARESYERMVGLSRFDEAQSVLDHIQLTDPEYRRAHNLIRVRVGRLIAFKRMLINDINAHAGYPKPVTSRRGNVYPRGIQLAANDSFQAGTPYGTIGVPWTDFSPQTILAVAAYYTDAATNLTQAADRRWLAANYALETGQANEARSLAVRAAQGNPEYEQEMEQFNGGKGAAAPLTPGKPVP